MGSVNNDYDNIGDFYKNIEELKEKKHEVLEQLMAAGLNIPFIIQQAFLGYKWLKREKKLYEKDGKTATELIKIYYGLNPGDTEFDKMRQGFINKYVKQESRLEGVHCKEELLGLEDMYKYLHSAEFDEEFSIYSLKELNKKLFSHAPYPEYAGIYRNDPRYLPGTGLNLCESYMIERELFFLSKDVDKLHKAAKVVKQLGSVDEMMMFLDECIELKCRLVWIHPFPDGNGRTIRAFINKLLEDAGLPPIYVKERERTEYHTAMNKAIGDGDYSAIKAFYRYKICDSIIELDINDRIKTYSKDNNPSTTSKEKTKKKRNEQNN
ncbi:MAG: Fic family protein [Bacilli bacterium]|nr:Fic family protein [Bacilli bacterium]